MCIGSDLLTLKNKDLQKNLPQKGLSAGERRHGIVEQMHPTASFNSLSNVLVLNDVVTA